ncbi:RagB/SusD family nutrient uptake outer membrane protein [Prevotella sp. 10(H)]|uniref:RagB/SusD family nutrient uptake outer membrane protein n=1 Tax=Prevotella sp. 10(H) TaxID=1158294 RepID=UPI0004A707FD|nr:RagB/SusD family nutrient uptake outer membrane protein [Prevotella sp. 10(H)]
MKKNIIKIMIAGAILFSATSCGDDFLSVNSSTQPEVGGPVTMKTLNQHLASAYQILLLDNYANGNYNSYILMGDLRSDDLYKGGGEANDQGALYFLSQFKNTPTDVPQGWWSIYYTGLTRCNELIEACSNVIGVTPETVATTLAEAHTLRALYMHQLWKMWGNVPYYEVSVLPKPYLAKQLKADEVYTEIMEDLDFALEGEKLRKVADESTFGRVTKPMAQMLRARTVMYQKDQTRYNQVLADMVEIIDNPAYGLMDDLEEVFLASGEFCKESLFETNQKADGKTWSESWIGFGTNLPAFVSPNGLSDPNDIFLAGWGFAPVRTEAYNIYSADDKRRDATINDFRTGKYTKRFQDTGLFIRKYAARKGYNDVKAGDADLNFDNNLRLFRLPEAYLNAAELLVGGATAPGAGTAQEYLDFVRRRAFGDKFDQNKVTATLDNIKKERRLEFMGEGLRYWDLVRWGDAPTVLTENIPAFSSERTWTAEKSKYLPIPQSEIDRTKNTDFELQQNPY